MNANERQGVLAMSHETLSHAPQSRSYIMRRAEVEQRTGFKRAYIYSLMKDGKFPKALRIGVRAVGWDSAEVDDWIAARRLDRV
jgi:prophage regulatory protein